ncbi:hypothetical protein LJB89_04555 [Tyzzerella sp. OttesenSCG-928-J15]|nr:hypothetical protein [Tyzzerella sp. OttesenSCG-928-J15]
MKNVVVFEVNWGTNESNGYTTCRLFKDKELIAECEGSGFDMVVSNFGEYIQNNFLDEVYAHRERILNSIYNNYVTFTEQDGKRGLLISGDADMELIRFLFDALGYKLTRKSFSETSEVYELYHIISHERERKREFVEELERVFLIGQPHFKSLEYIDKHGDGEYVVATCKNGAVYRVDVTGDSLPSLVYDVYNELRGK